MAAAKAAAKKKAAAKAKTKPKGGGKGSKSKDKSQAPIGAMSRPHAALDPKDDPQGRCFFYNLQLVDPSIYTPGCRYGRDLPQEA